MTRRGRRGYPPEVRARVLALYGGGEKVDAGAAEVGIARSTVSWWAGLAGLGRQTHPKRGPRS